jgi:hypothetical protein
MNLIVEFQYFPSVILFKILNKNSNILFEQYEFYQKMSFRNRCQIAGADGIIQLSIPLEQGRDQKTIMKDVRIADRQDWQAQHWKTILSCYSRSPWFEFYRDELAKLYREPFTFLMDWDLACFEWSARTLDLPLNISLTDAWQKNYEKNEWLDWRNKLLPNAVRKLSDVPNAAAEPLITPVTICKDLTPGPASPEPTARYHQVYEERTGFLPGLSILDLLFCEGKNARSILI